MADIRIRPFKPEELEELARLEAASSPYPFSKSRIQSEMEQPHARILVALDGKKIVGYLDYWAVDEEGHVINITVDAAYRRRQIASRLFAAMRKAHPEVTSLFLEVRPSNQAALALYQKLGFQAVHTRKGYYPDGEDALVMRSEVALPA